MLKKLTRLLPFLLLAIAMPLNGLAAASAGVCMALGHHDSAPAAKHSHPADVAAPGHEHMTTDAPLSEESSDSHCGPCLACCAASSIVARLVVPDPVASPGGVELPPHAASLRFLPDALDRPPLTLPA